MPSRSRLREATLLIGKGRLYVDGLLAENHGAVSSDPAKRLFDDLMGEPAFADPIPYDAQPYLPNPPALPTTGTHLVYLVVWKREVTNLEQPDLIETAVGVDTSSRLQTVWQVARARRRRRSRHHLRVARCRRAGLERRSSRPPPACSAPAPSTSPRWTTRASCRPTGGYRGLENQLYRVEIHNPGQPGAGATFKWSRDDVGSRVATVVSANELKLETLGRDDVLRFNTGDWVEIIDDEREFSLGRGEMRRITVIEATQSIQFADALPAAMLPPPANLPDSVFPRVRHTRVRRWNQKGQDTPHRLQRHAGRSAGSRRNRIDRGDQRPRGGHDAAPGKRRDGQLRIHGSRGISHRRLLGLCGAHGGCLGRDSRPRAAARHRSVTMRDWASGTRPPAR